MIECKAAAPLLVLDDGVAAEELYELGVQSVCLAVHRLWHAGHDRVAVLVEELQFNVVAAGVLQQDPDELLPAAVDQHTRIGLDRELLGRL